MTSSTPAIEVTNLEKVFKDFWQRPRAKAVNGISMSIQPGEVFGLLGPNGSGKSTTIKMLLGLLHPTSGNIKVLGRSPRDVQTKARIGYLPEETYLYNYLDARETLEFYAKLFEIPQNERKERIDQLLEMVGLQHTAKRTIKEFSKGMARRIGLAQALINRPELVILDEPTSGLDPIGCRQVKDLIRALSEGGTTVLLSSHLLADVEDVCDRISILYGGEIQAEGSIKSLLTESNRTRIDLPDCAPDQLQQILDSARNILQQEPEHAHPLRSLEQFFLEVVENAAAQPNVSSGAQSGTALAPFLQNNKPSDNDF